MSGLPHIMSSMHVSLVGFSVHAALGSYGPSGHGLHVGISAAEKSKLSISLWVQGGRS